MNICKSLQAVVLTAIILGLQFNGHAQVNLVNLYDWTPESMFSYSSSQGVNVISSTSADLDVFTSINFPSSGPQYTVPALTGYFDTTPGETYEISFNTRFFVHGNLSSSMNVTFGNDTVNIAAYNCFLDGMSYTNFFDYTVVATSASTAMKVNFWSDNGESLTLSDFSVTSLPVVNPVPEASTASLLGLGVCVWLLAPLCRRASGRQKSEAR